MKRKRIKEFLLDVLSIIAIIIFVIFVFLSLGFGLIFIDSFTKEENRYDDWHLMEEWERKENKRIEKEKKV